LAGTRKYARRGGCACDRERRVDAHQLRLTIASPASTSKRVTSSAAPSVATTAWRRGNDAMQTTRDGDVHQQEEGGRERGEGEPATEYRVRWQGHDGGWLQCTLCYKVDPCFASDWVAWCRRSPAVRGSPIASCAEAPDLRYKAYGVILCIGRCAQGARPIDRRIMRAPLSRGPRFHSVTHHMWVGMYGIPGLRQHSIIRSSKCVRPAP
jgi:hypothetical protein